eukprot:GHVU01027027.1.p1 GENE.GHVU01027027.1~~GHVU01027027.1.p1  ORF type:complete len:340 (+),score=51.57 GHVU01027027.1:37-1020(+)
MYQERSDADSTTETLRIVALEMEMKRNNRFNKIMYGTVAILVVAMSLGVLLIATFVVRSGTYGKTGMRAPEYHVINLSAIPDLPLDMVMKMDTLRLKWGDVGGPDEKTYMYSVESVMQDATKHTTELRLSSNHKLVVYKGTHAVLQRCNPVVAPVCVCVRGGVYVCVCRRAAFATGKAELFDEEGNQINVLQFTEPSPTLTTNTLRRLMKYGGETKPGAKNVFEMYCKYGCGQMGLTFPYYYRPFFGSGYPLVGTEGFFPAGYGGNPVTELAAKGLMGTPGGGINAFGGDPGLNNMIQQQTNTGYGMGAAGPYQQNGGYGAAGTPGM